MENGYAGKVWAVYRETDEHHKFGAYRIMVSLFDSLRGAEKYVEARERKDGFRGENHDYSIVPWLVQRG